MGGVPTNGAWGMGGKNVDNTVNRPIFMMVGCTYSALLDAPPSSITLTPLANLNWPAVPTVVQTSEFGFALSGTSNAVAPNINASIRGLFTINY
jgi:hypothetical protein